MNRFKVQAQGANGKRETLIVAADNDLDAAHQVRKRGLVPLSVRKAGNVRSTGSGGSKVMSTRLIRELSALLMAGLTVEKALLTLSGFTGRGLPGALAGELLQSVRGGQSLSQAFATRPDMFPAPLPQIAEAGEASGSLGRSLADLADWQERNQNFESELRGAMIYPLILMAFTIIVVLALLVFLIPRFESVFEDMGTTPPGFTQFVFSLADSVQTWLPLGLAGIAAIVILGGLWWRQESSRHMVFAALYRWPGTGTLVRTLLTTRFTRVLSVLLQNGMLAAPAFRLAAQSLRDVYARDKLENALAEVRRGASLSGEVAKADVFPPLAGEILRVGEETGDLTPAATRLADLYEARLERGMKLAIRLIEPALIGLAGIVIGAIVISILLAVVSINDLGAQ